MIKKQFLKFIVMGIFSTIINYVIFYIIFAIFHMNYLLAASLGFVIGVFAGYFLNKNWTFEVKRTSNIQILKYYVVYIASLILSLAFLKITVGWMGISAPMANLFAIGITTCTNFLGTKFLVFQK